MAKDESAKPRREVVQFAGLMESRLAANDHKSHWEAEDTDWLLGRLLEEVEELKAEVANGDLGGSEQVRQECADVANFAMMIADNLRIHVPR
jgi:NTP pyrophosphatase (non-canonical NTP hydrolase)